MTDSKVKMYLGFLLDLNNKEIELSRRKIQLLNEENERLIELVKNDDEKEIYELFYKRIVLPIKNES